MNSGEILSGIAEARRDASWFPPQILPPHTMSESPADNAAPPTRIVDKHPTPPRSTPSPTALDTSNVLFLIEG